MRSIRQDEVMREVRAIREAYAARFGYDIDAISRDARVKEAQSGHEVVSRPPKRIKKATAKQGLSYEDE
ncbi:MAG: hypothetical protein ACR2GR_08595 [Rhodothermales bacterium]